MRRLFSITILSLMVAAVSAQVGQYRNEFAVGVNGGLTMTKVNFLPKIPQDQLKGKTVGLTLRYTGEKYFNSICAIVGEVNLVETGWQERILDIEDQPVPTLYDANTNEKYSRKLTYIQIPVFARLGWGRERRGVQFFFQAGPQVGFMKSEKTETNFDVNNFNIDKRSSKISKQYEMAVEHNIDYGIAAAAGLEFSNPTLGHMLLEGRYYYGLGNLYGNSKRDYFAISNFQGIVVKLTYLFDITRTNNPKIK